MRFLTAALLMSALSMTLLQAQSGEFRGVWIASVWNLNYPSKQGLSVEQQKREIIALLDTAKRSGLNAVLVQVRPESCALYPSQHEPWSRFLTGSQGKSPGFDPLETFVQEGKRRGLAVHAWFNPYRAAINAKQSRHPAHISNRYPRFTKRIGSYLWMDPGSPEVRAFIVKVIADVARRYDVAGIHIDDYFYPYPAPGKTINFPDAETYEAYRRGGGRLALNDWRRENVNAIVRDIHRAVKGVKPSLLFGVSPFGIYTKGQPADVKAGLDQLKQLHADPLHWMREGWVDYLAPQLYWRDGGPQSFSSLLRWWRSPAVNPRGIPIYPGIAIDRLGGSHNWPLSEIQRQLALEKSIGPRRRGGFILYNIKPLQQNLKGVRSAVGSG